MVDIVTIAYLFAGLVLLFGNGYFVAIEFAMTRIRQFEKHEFQQSDSLSRAWDMTEELEIYLSGCQLGITICSVGLGVVAEPALTSLIDPLFSSIGFETTKSGHTAFGAIASLGIINLLHLTIGEQAPTYFGIERTKTMAKYGSPLLYWWTKILSPIIRLADSLAKSLLGLVGVTITRSWAEDEIEEASNSSSRGEMIRDMGDILSNMGLPKDRQQEVLNAVAIDNLQTGSIMIDRDDIISISTSQSIEDQLSVIRETSHTRIPLVGDGIDDIVGTIYVSELLTAHSPLENEEIDLEDVTVEPVVVTPDLPVSELIDTFQDEQQELAVVVEDGETVGLVTSTDAFEAIAGDLEDPFDS